MILTFLRSPAALWTIGIVTAIAAGVSRLALNSILRVLATEHPQRWERYGRPSGLFSSPRGSFLGSELRFFRDPTLELLFRTPIWLTQSPGGLGALRVFRVSALVMVLGLLLIAFAAFWSF